LGFGLDMPKSQDDCDKLNIVEKKKFMDGQKSVAIISEAASMGISLRAALGSAAAHKRRVHFTIEVVQSLAALSFALNIRNHANILVCCFL
jgi:hypothetical protein